MSVNTLNNNIKSDRKKNKLPSIIHRFESLYSFRVRFEIALPNINDITSA